MMAPRRRRRRRWLEMMALSSVLVVAAPSMASTASRVSRSGAHIDLVRAARATLLVAPVAVSAPWTSATARRISSSRLRARRRRHRSSICDELSMAMTACRSPAAASMVVLSPPPAPPPRRRLPPYTVLLDIAFSGAEILNPPVRWSGLLDGDVDLHLHFPANVHATASRRACQHLQLQWLMAMGKFPQGDRSQWKG